MSLYSKCISFWQYLVRFYIFIHSDNLQLNWNIYSINIIVIYTINKFIYLLFIVLLVSICILCFLSTHKIYFSGTCALWDISIMCLRLYSFFTIQIRCHSLQDFLCCSHHFMLCSHVTLWVYVIVFICPCSVSKSCLTLCDPMDCSPPGSSIHGILQASILEWVAISFSRGSS